MKLGLLQSMGSQRVGRLNSNIISSNDHVRRAGGVGKRHHRRDIAKARFAKAMQLLSGSIETLSFLEPSCYAVRKPY